MCFSPTASFAASAALTVVGAASVVKMRDRAALPFALIPLIFALQQFVEGLLWLALPSGSFVMPLTYAYLFFAFFWWPMYAPAAAYVLENEERRKKIISGLVVLGTGIGGTLYAIFVAHPFPARVVDSCVAYHLQISTASGYILTMLYIMVVVVAWFESSNRSVKVLGVLYGVTAAIASWFYFENFTSVWCFFAALLSVAIYLLFL